MRTARDSRVWGLMVVAIALISFAGNLSADPGTNLKELVKWYGETYAGKPQDATLIARVATFEVGQGNKEAFIAALRGLKNDDEFSRRVAAMAGFFRTPEVRAIVLSKLKDADDPLRRELLYTMLNMRPDIVPEKEVVLELLRSGDREVKVRTLYVARTAWGRQGAEIYAAAFDNTDTEVRETAFASARMTGARAFPEAKEWLRKYLQSAPKETLAGDWYTAGATDVRACVDYLEAGYGIGKQAHPKDHVVATEEHVKRLLDMTDRIDVVVNEVRAQYAGEKK